MSGVVPTSEDLTVNCQKKRLYGFHFGISFSPRQYPVATTQQIESTPL